MYSIERANDRVIVRYGEGAIFSAPMDSFIVHMTSPTNHTIQISILKDLNDKELLMALVNAVEIKDFRQK